jgi:hypothetical protein
VIRKEEGKRLVAGMGSGQVGMGRELFEGGIVVVAEEGTAVLEEGIVAAVVGEDIAAAAAVEVQLGQIEAGH